MLRGPSLRACTHAEPRGWRIHVGNGKHASRRPAPTAVFGTEKLLVTSPARVLYRAHIRRWREAGCIGAEYVAAPRPSLPHELVV